MNNTGKILLVGDISKAFLDAAAIAGINHDKCKTLSEAIEAVKNETYSAIAIVMSGLQTKLSSSIATLRDICRSSHVTRNPSDESRDTGHGARATKIVLLAQMYEEPIAIRLACSSYNDKPLVDDYLICPVQEDYFLSSKFCVPSSEPISTKDESHISAFSTQNLPRPAATCCDSATARRAVHEHGGLAADMAGELSARIRLLEKMATEDDLIGLKNRRYIMEFTRQILEYARKENGRVTVLVFDIDDFKKYNDLYGHMAGDEVLKQAAHLMKRCCRAHDVVGRIGGDEFAVIFWDDPSILKAVIEQSKKSDRRSIDSDHPHEAMLIAKRFVSELEKTPPISSEYRVQSSEYKKSTEFIVLSTENTELRTNFEHRTQNSERQTGLGPGGIGTLTISGGLASYPRDGKTVQELFEQADKALLEAKRSGKNRIYLVGKPKN